MWLYNGDIGGDFQIERPQKSSKPKCKKEIQISDLIPFVTSMLLIDDGMTEDVQVGSPICLVKCYYIHIDVYNIHNILFLLNFQGFLYIFWNLGGSSGMCGVLRLAVR